MEEKNQFQNSLEDWARETIEAYHMIAQEVNLAFYTQSDLSILRESPELAIVGINPGGKEKDTYEGQRKNKNWSYLYNNPLELDKNHLLKGNYCHEEGKPSYWDKHKKWSYWSGLKRCLSNTYLSNDIEDDSKINVTNASFFSTPTAKEISEDLLIKTIPYTLELIEKTTPKHLIFLSGKKCFERLSRLSKSSELVNFEYRHVCGSIYIGRLEYRLNESFNTMKCIGIPHPAYKTNEELNLVAAVIPFLINLKRYEDVDIELINNECHKQIFDYKERIHNKIRDINLRSGNIKIDKKHIANEIISKINLEPYDEKNNRYVLINNIGITITKKDNGCIELRAIEDSKLPSEYINLVKETLQKRGYDININNWIGRKLFTQFGQNDEDIVNKVLKEINELKHCVSLVKIHNCF